MITIVPYSPELSEHFYTINVEWIENMFCLEEIDKNILLNPQKEILSKGGDIWFAHHSELGYVGTCALKKIDSDYYELTKMGVLEKARGHKIGEYLLKHVISYVKKNDIKYCYLLTNKKCQAAIHLYEKNGFIHDNNILKRFGGDYQRCNVAMILT